MLTAKFVILLRLSIAENVTVRSMLRGTCLILCHFLLASPAGTKPLDAMLLVEQGVTKRGLEVIRMQLQRRFQIVAVHQALNVLEREPKCESEQMAQETLSWVRKGTDEFFMKTDIEAATESLSMAIKAFMEVPCIFRGKGDVLRELCSAAVLLIRLHVLAGKEKEARDLAKWVAAVFPKQMVEGSGEPPEILDIVAQERDERIESELIFVEAGFDVLVNGIRISEPSRVSLPSGIRNEIAFLLQNGEVFVWRGKPRQKMVFDLALAGTIGERDDGSLELRDRKERGAEIAGRISETTGVAVLLVTGEHDGWLKVKEFVAGTQARNLLRTRPITKDSESFEVVMEPGGMLTRSPLWPWPYISAGLSAGLTGAGIYLNILANRAARSVNLGTENVLDEYRTYKRWSIACYSFSAVLAGASIALYFLRPEPAERFIVHQGPLSSGVTLKF